MGTIKYTENADYNPASSYDATVSVSYGPTSSIAIGNTPGMTPDEAILEFANYDTDQRSYIYAPSLSDFLKIKFLGSVENFVSDGISADFSENENQVRLSGGLRSDVLRGGTGNDSLRGNLGDDVLEGGAGADTFYGGNGSDTVSYEHALGSVTASLARPAGNRGDAAGDSYDSIENLRGSGFADTLVGDDSANVLDGGEGADRLFGGAGDDTYIVDQAGDLLYEGIDAGTDTVEASVSYKLRTNIENLTLTGAGDLNGTGNDAANILIGNAGANTLDGRGGADTLIGGDGNDRYVVDDAGDMVTEAFGEGTDTVLSSVTYTLRANVENLTLTGTGNLNGTGNAAGNEIIGNDGNNKLDGGAGADILRGGAGNDTYTIENLSDRVVERANGGNDTIRSSRSFSLTDAPNVEKLQLTGDDDRSVAYGSNGNDVLVGNGVTNLLVGGPGNDKLTGGLGADTFLFDTELGRTNIDKITDFDVGVDTIALSFEGASALGNMNGELNEGVFADITNGTAGITEDTRLLYDGNTGALSYDADGSGAGKSIVLAVLDNLAAITADDIFVSRGLAPPPPP